MLGVFLLFAAIAAIDLRTVFKGEAVRDKIVVCTLFLGIFAVCILVASKAPIRNPLLALGELMQRVGLAYPLYGN